MQNVIGHQIRLFNDSSKKKIIIQICTLSLFSLVVSHIHKHTHSERELINGYINSKHNTYHFACFSFNLFQLYFQQVYLVNQVVDHCALQIVAVEAFVLCLFWNLIYCDCIEVQRFFSSSLQWTREDFELLFVCVYNTKYDVFLFFFYVFFNLMMPINTFCNSPPE